MMLRKKKLPLYLKENKHCINHEMDADGDVNFSCGTRIPFVSLLLLPQSKPYFFGTYNLQFSSYFPFAFVKKNMTKPNPYFSLYLSFSYLLCLIAAKEKKKKVKIDGFWFN